MIYHASVPADDPERVARVIAELWGGTYHPFIAPGTFLVLANDDRGTELEIAPRGTVLFPADNEVGFQRNPAASPFSEVHINLATVLSYEEALSVAAREGWIARVCDRGGFFKLVEFWLENKFMLELMSPMESERYRGIMHAEFWRKIPAQRPAR